MLDYSVRAAYPAVPSAQGARYHLERASFAYPISSTYFAIRSLQSPEGDHRSVELERLDCLALADIGATVVVQPERVLAVAEDFGDRPI